MVALIARGWTGETPAQARTGKQGYRLRPDLVIKDEPEFVARWHSLTEREQWAFRCRARGLGNTECAAEAGVSASSIKKALARGYVRLEQWGDPAFKVCRVAYLLGLYEALVTEQ